MSRQPALVVSLLICLFGGPASGLYAQRGTAPKVETENVLVLTSELDAGAIIEQDHLKVEAWPRQLVPEGVVSEKDKAVGKKLENRKTRNSVLLLSDLQATSSVKTIPAGMKVIALKIPPGVIIEPGDRVNVLIIYGETKQGERRNKSKTIARDVVVFSVAEPVREGHAGVVDLLVDEKQAEQIVTEKSKPSKLRLAMVGRQRDAKSDQKESLSTSQAGKIREMARQLDEVAASMEALDLFEEADRVRKTARELRLKARSK